MPLFIGAMAGMACDQRAPESAACAERALEQVASVHALREAESGSLEFDLWVRPDPPTIRVPAALQVGGDPVVLRVAACELLGSESVVLALQKALADTCGLGIGVERTGESCEQLPLRTPGLGYIVDDPE
ncbi:MAG: hypothetical protein DCC71_24600 [Proteobacteria bacterium]|nr:MAG: hypothetical protein DCC71_24600 [Pseudomonadota bacterium]